MQDRLPGLLMHSTVIKGTDFSIRLHGQPISHANFFANFSPDDRLALVTPRGDAGLGAACLLLGFVTAFYDHWRREGGESIRYPGFFTVQNPLPCADYCMLDIWPYHRNLYFADQDTAWQALTNRRVKILLVPDACLPPPAIRDTASCYVYSADGYVEDGNLELGLGCHLVKDYLLEVIDSLPQEVAGESRRYWEKCLAGQTLVQRFRQIGAPGAVSQG